MRSAYGDSWVLSSRMDMMRDSNLVMSRTSLPTEEMLRWRVGSLSLLWNGLTLFVIVLL